tara:strand:- start:804 stop:1184 length:381 start_codon:yes stop_codon:yes gene_type:complete
MEKYENNDKYYYYNDNNSLNNDNSNYNHSQINLYYLLGGVLFFLSIIQGSQLLCICKNKLSGYCKYKNLEESLTEITEKECSICLESFNLNDKIFNLNCGHIFHKKCLKEWINKDKNECPLCRNII